MSGEIERYANDPLPPAWRQAEHGIEPIPERWPRDAGPGLMRPDFILAGVRLPDGRFQLVASRQVNGSELNVDFGYRDIGIPGLDPQLMFRRKVTLTAELGDLLMVEGTDYGTCMAEVARRWQEGHG